MACSGAKLTKSSTPETILCNPSAFVDLDQYKVTILTSTDDAEFHAWANGIISKQPELLLAYRELRSCWEYYHKDK